MVLHIFRIRSTYLFPVSATRIAWYIIPYPFDVELLSTALSTVRGPIPCTSMLFYIVPCWFFLSSCGPAAAFEPRRLEISLQINSGQTAGNYKNNLESKRLMSFFQLNQLNNAGRTNQIPYRKKKICQNKFLRDGSIEFEALNTTFNPHTGVTSPCQLSATAH